MELPKEIRFEKKDHVGIITIDRPEALNSLTADMLLGIEDAFKAFDDDPELWVGILTASGEKAFSSGLDLKEAAPMLTGAISWASRIGRSANFPMSSSRSFARSTAFASPAAWKCSWERTSGSPRNTRLSALGR